MFSACIPITLKPEVSCCSLLLFGELLCQVFLAGDTGVFSRSVVAGHVLPVPVLCGPQAAQLNPAIKKAGDLARPKTTMVPPPRPRPSSAPPARPPRLLRDREDPSQQITWKVSWSIWGFLRAQALHWAVPHNLGLGLERVVEEDRHVVVLCYPHSCRASWCVALQQSVKEKVLEQ